MSTLPSLRRQKAGKPMKHDKQKICISNETFGEWRQLRKHLYPFETTIYPLAICYCIVLHMKLSVSMKVNWQKL